MQDREGPRTAHMAVLVLCLSRREKAPCVPPKVPRCPCALPRRRATQLFKMPRGGYYGEISYSGVFRELVVPTFARLRAVVQRVSKLKSCACCQGCTNAFVRQPPQLPLLTPKLCRVPCFQQQTNQSKALFAFVYPSSQDRFLRSLQN